VTSKLLEKVVTVLLMYNVDHAVLTPESFENPRIWSRRCRIKTIFELDGATVRLLPRKPNLVLFTSYWSLINGSCEMDTSSAKSQSAPLQNAGPWIYVTEEEVEERLLTNESWLSGLMPEEGHYSTTAADDPATPAPATPITKNGQDDVDMEDDGQDSQSFLDERSVGSQSENGVEEPMDGGENPTNGQAALADAPPAAPMHQQRSGNPGMVNGQGQQQQQPQMQSNQDFGGFLSSVKNLIRQRQQQQQAGVLPQDAGQVVAPAGGPRWNAAPQAVQGLSNQQAGVNNQRPLFNPNMRAQQAQAFNAQQAQAQAEQMNLVQSQAQIRVNAQAKAQQMALHGQPRGMRPMPPQQSPAMTTLNAPLRTLQQLQQPQQPNLLDALRMNQPSTANFGQPLDTRFAQMNQQRNNQGSLMNGMGLNGPTFPANMPREHRQRLMALPKEKLNEVIGKWNSVHQAQAGKPQPPANVQSGPSASSSTMGSPYSNHGQTVPGPEWNSTGLGINPSIVGGAYDGFAQDFSYTTSGMDHELAFTDVTKSHVFVGECPKVSESSSFVSTFVPSNLMGMIGSLLDRNGSDTSTLRSTQSPRSAITPPSSGSDFFFKSPSTPASSTSPLSKRRFSQSNSSTAGRTQDCRSSPFLSTTQSFQPDVIERPSYTTTYHRSPFFSQTSGQFIAPLNLHVCFLCHFPTRTVPSRCRDRFL
jgi:hypothetical protein